MTNSLSGQTAMDRARADVSDAPRRNAEHVRAVASTAVAPHRDSVFHLLSETLGLLVLVVDATGHIALAAGRWAEVAGWADPAPASAPLRFEPVIDLLARSAALRDEIRAAILRVLGGRPDRSSIDLSAEPAGEDRRWRVLHVLPASGGTAALLIIEDVTEHRSAQVALERMQRRYGLATSAGRVGVWDLNLDTGEIFLDTTLKSLLGYLEREIDDTLESWLGFVHPADLRRVEEQLREHLAGRTALYEAEHRKLNRDGGVRWFLARGMLIERRNGRPYRIVGTEVDITERKEIEHAFETEHRKYRKLFEEAGIALCEVDLTGGEAVRPAAAGTSGRPGGQSLEMDRLRRGGIVTHANAHAVELFGGWTGTDGPVVSFAGLESGVWLELLEAAAAGSARFEREATVALPSGERRDIVLCATFPNHETPDLAVVSALDVSDRKRAQRALRASEERYGLATRAGLVSVWELDTTTGDLLTDGVLHEILGLDTAPRWPRSVWLGRVHPEDRSRVEAYMADLVAHSGTPDDRVPAEIEYRLRHQNGSYRWVCTRGSAVGAIAGARLVGTTMDVTGRKTAEAALRVTRAGVRRRRRKIRKLATQLVHAREAERRRIGQELHDDICQRLAALELLATDALQRRTGGDGATMGEIRTRLGELSRDVRRLSHHLTAPALEGDELERHLQAYADELTRLARLHVHLDVRDLPARIPPEVALCVYRVVQEALHNVARHARTGSADVQLCGRAGGLQLVIADEGCGFDPGGLGSAGLGLANMKERMQRLLGRFEVVTGPGRGTRIEAWLPLKHG
jgi:PAS domain S-box-containing protein